ncbi:peptidoglycan DD-metalloendopeptidase family protein [Halothermothrix orenii]|uniref:Peptidase M23B n=1 Tax=Halothermothrix orenii (strain H 168 / OCM 544 / DSM 9562) TaxID=373903 RepID=B8CX37_HALOH|nr:peptidoglycan DD-metalloendopeptidase family protein [Halothermothrix orenii]ACL69856.1 peptidase M23B [Halothermothrix orenii H 168]
MIISSPVLATTLKLGDRGREVKKVQQILRDLGYDIEVDSVFGYRTKQVVQAFQLNNGLDVDGIVGDKTLNLLHEMVEETKYIVNKGDTLSEIALKTGSTVQAIKDRNNLKSSKIYTGQKLYIPKTGIGGGKDGILYDRIIHVVQRGDALYNLAKRYGTEVETIKLANNLHSNRIFVGQTLVIPHLKEGRKHNFRLKKGAFIWPVLGRISSPYGYRIHPITNKREFHGGIDIAVPIGTRIRAAASGTVIQSGWIRGFGKTIIIDHENGIRTLYAHNSRLLIRAGQKVKLGDVIALAGSTGMSTGPHLDFRIYNKGKTVNPINYLP